MEFFIYLLKVNIAILLFYSIFRIVFQKDTFFRWKRFALLAIIFISFIYPAIDLTKQIIANNKLNNIFEIVYIPVYTLPEFVITANTNTAINFFPQIVLAIYLLVSGFLLIRMLFQIGTILYKLRNTTKKVFFGHTVYESPGLKTPFSFFRWIVLDSTRYSEMELQEILLHESTHVKHGHSIDTMLAEILCVFCWFNPFAWLLKVEIRVNLEFLADSSVLSSGYEAEHYQFHLLRLSYHKAAATITNNFNVSLLKKRIFMMNKKQTSLRSIWKYALILPVIALLLFFNSSFQTKAEPEYLTDIVLMDNEMIIIQTDNEMYPAQQTPVTKQDDKPVSNEKKMIFSHVEEPPQFPGGEQALFKWLKDNIVYPESAMKEGIQGVVNTRFVVAPDGSIEDVQITKSLDPFCDREAIRAVKNMPRWIPGKQNGNPVYVYFNMPVRFRLDDGNSNNSNTKKILDKVDEPPQFPGGDLALFNYLRNNIVYPTIAAENGIAGRVIVQFVIAPDGSIEDIEVPKSLDPACDREAIRAVKNMPKWIPGKHNGQPVHVYFRLPVSFAISGTPPPPPPLTTASQANNTLNEIVVTSYGRMANTNRNIVVEIDGKVVSDEEFKNFDTKTVESININNEVNPNRIIIKTKK